MKILYVDIATDGHHLQYLFAFIKNNNAANAVVLPENIEDNDVPQYVCEAERGGKRNYKNYKKWIDRIFEIAQLEKPDIIHFLYGDYFYKFFGLGLKKFRNYKIVVTLHKGRLGFAEKISTRMISNRVDKIVVHSDYIKKFMDGYGVKHVVHVEYPNFNKIEVSKSEACSFWKMDEDIPTIVCMGNTRYNKGLDILLEALNKVNLPFQLLVAGKEEAFDENYIVQSASDYKDRVKLCLRYLSDEEFANALAVADIIAIPYRKSFNGASGPLGEGVAMDKCIVGPNHGTLGYTVAENHLGYVFESENVLSLAQTLEKALSTPFECDENYKQYKNSLNPYLFIEKHKQIYNELIN